MVVSFAVGNSSRDGTGHSEDVFYVFGNVAMNYVLTPKGGFGPTN